MLKLAIAVLAVALAGTASAGWRSLRVDGSSEAAFKESVAAFRESLPEVRRHVFEQSLNDIWEAGTKAAEADEREFAMSDYLRQIDGLSYKDVVELTDPTGDTADRYFNEVYAKLYGRSSAANVISAQPGLGVAHPGVVSYGSYQDGGRNAPPGVNPWQR